MALRRIEDLNVSGRDWSFKENGITLFLKDSGRRVNNHYYKVMNKNIEQDRVFRIFGGGQLLENNQLGIYFILEKMGTNEMYLVSASELTNQMIETTF